MGFGWRFGFPSIPVGPQVQGLQGLQGLGLGHRLIVVESGLVVA